MRGWQAVGALVVALVAAALCGMLMAVTLLRIEATLHAAERDAVFVARAHCVEGVVPCARQLFFNGDWRGVFLCRGSVCKLYEDIFPDERISVRRR